jgi:hypothetical protein
MAIKYGDRDIGWSKICRQRGIALVKCVDCHGRWRGRPQPNVACSLQLPYREGDMVLMKAWEEGGALMAALKDL